MGIQAPPATNTGVRSSAATIPAPKRARSRSKTVPGAANSRLISLPQFAATALAALQKTHQSMIRVLMADRKTGLPTEVWEVSGACAPNRLYMGQLVLNQVETGPGGGVVITNHRLQVAAETGQVQYLMVSTRPAPAPCGFALVGSNFDADYPQNLSSLIVPMAQRHGLLRVEPIDVGPARALAVLNDQHLVGLVPATPEGKRLLEWVEADPHYKLWVHTSWHIHRGTQPHIEVSLHPYWQSS